VLQEEKKRLESLRKRYNLTNEKISHLGNIAKSLGLHEEHKIFLKIYSKLVHPTSYLINDPDNAAADEIRNLLHAFTQIYALDTCERICDEFSIPKSIREPLEMPHNRRE